MAGNKDNIKPMWKLLKTKLDLEPPVPFDGNVYLGCGQEDVVADDKFISQQCEYIERLQSQAPAKDEDSKDETEGNLRDVPSPKAKATPKKKRKKAVIAATHRIDWVDVEFEVSLENLCAETFVYKRSAHHY